MRRTRFIHALLWGTILWIGILLKRRSIIKGLIELRIMDHTIISRIWAWSRKKTTICSWIYWWIPWWRIRISTIRCIIMKTCIWWIMSWMRIWIAIRIRVSNNFYWNGNTLNRKEQKTIMKWSFLNWQNILQLVDLIHWLKTFRKSMNFTIEISLIDECVSRKAEETLLKNNLKT